MLEDMTYEFFEWFLDQVRPFEIVTGMYAFQCLLKAAFVAFNDVIGVSKSRRLSCGGDDLEMGNVKAAGGGLRLALAKAAKMAAEAVIVAACLMWVLYWFYKPEPQADDTHLSNNTRSRFFRTDGREGFPLIYQTLPFVIVAILSFLVIELRTYIRSREPMSTVQVQQKLRHSSISTYPLWVRSPFGVLTIADSLFIIGVLFVLFYHFGRVTHLSFQEIEHGTVMHHHGPIVSKYETLVLVAGGIGVTPILAILQDILYRYKKALHKSSHLPTSIEVYHCVRTPEELCVLNEIDPNQILPDYNKLGLNIHVHAYITSKVRELYTDQLETHLSAGETTPLDLSKFGGSNRRLTTRFVSPNFGAQPRGVSRIASVGDTKWVACISISSMIGYFVLSGLANLYIVKAYKYNFSNYNRAHVVVICMLLGIMLFGGALLIIWAIHLKSRKENTSSIQPKGNYVPAQDFYDNEAIVGSEGGSPWDGGLHLCCRPHWKDVFNHLSSKYKGQSVGVLVSGTQSMQEDVASECRRHSKFLLPITSNNVAFEYHSVSFDL
ncbi:hypothetical protein L7F22_065733 [Adiantum nelumboides]|nr:hypothetical protein [Adiantum nelumboides]